MKQSTLSMVVFTIYLWLLGLSLLMIPNQVITRFGVPATKEVWIRVLGMVLSILAFYYSMAVREGVISMYRWSVYGRLSIFPTFCALVLLGYAPPVLLLVGAFDSGCAVWTGVALHREKSSPVVGASH